MQILIKIFILFMQIPPVWLMSRVPLCHAASANAEIEFKTRMISNARCAMMTNNVIAINFHHYYAFNSRPFLPPSCRCWISCGPTCAWRCSGSGGSPMWTVSTCTAFSIASSTGCSGVTARACGAVSPTTGRPEQTYTVAKFKLMNFQCKKKKKKHIRDNKTLESFVKQILQSNYV